MRSFGRKTADKLTADYAPSIGFHALAVSCVQARQYKETLPHRSTAIDFRRPKKTNEWAVRLCLRERLVHYHPPRPSSLTTIAPARDSERAAIHRGARSRWRDARFSKARAPPTTTRAWPTIHALIELKSMLAYDVRPRRTAVRNVAHASGAQLRRRNEVGRPRSLWTRRGLLRTRALVARLRFQAGKP